MDTLIVQIMNQAQKLVNADRASLFLVDSKTKQLYARFRTSNLGDIDLKHDNQCRIFDVSGGVIADVKQAPQDVRYFIILLGKRDTDNLCCVETRPGSPWARVSRATWRTRPRH